MCDHRLSASSVSVKGHPKSCGLLLAWPEEALHLLCCADVHENYCQVQAVRIEEDRLQTLQRWSNKVWGSLPILMTCQITCYAAR